MKAQLRAEQEAHAEAEAQRQQLLGLMRNLAVFTLDPATGVLAFRNVGPTYESGEHGGPVAVEFNPVGTKLAVSTWGITHASPPTST